MLLLFVNVLEFTNEHTVRYYMLFGETPAGPSVLQRFLSLAGQVFSYRPFPHKPFLSYTVNCLQNQS